MRWMGIQLSGLFGLEVRVLIGCQGRPTFFGEGGGERRVGPNSRPVGTAGPAPLIPPLIPPLPPQPLPRRPSRSFKPAQRARATTSTPCNHTTNPTVTDLNHLPPPRSDALQMSCCHISPPFRADHIGSLKRPIELLKLRAEFDAGKVSREELKALEDSAIKAEVAKQRAAGLKSFTDGEFRRHMFWDGFFNNLDGMVTIENPSKDLFKMYVPDVKAFFESHAEKPGSSPSL